MLAFFRTKLTAALHVFCSGLRTGEYNGVYTPWLTNEEERAFYPTNYSGPPYSSGDDDVAKAPDKDEALV
eukprot:COSAG06_NODE_28735_length_569_cov_0.763830_2_plen_70_part_00